MTPGTHLGTRHGHQHHTVGAHSHGRSEEPLYEVSRAKGSGDSSVGKRDAHGQKIRSEKRTYGSKNSQETYPGTPRRGPINLQLKARASGFIGHKRSLGGFFLYGQSVLGPQNEMETLSLKRRLWRNKERDLGNEV